MTAEHIVTSLSNYVNMLAERAEEYSRTAAELRKDGDLAKCAYYQGMEDECGRICNTLGLMAGISSVEIGLISDRDGDD